MGHTFTDGDMMGHSFTDGVMKGHSFTDGDMMVTPSLVVAC